MRYQSAMNTRAALVVPTERGGRRGECTKHGTLKDPSNRPNLAPRRGMLLDILAGPPLSDE